MNRSDLPTVVIGAGPVGLAAAAHLTERGRTPLILEAGAEPAATIRQWAHVRLFSPWRYNLDQASVRLLGRSGWRSPPADELPTGAELIERYLRPLADLPEISERLRLRHRVIGVSRLGMDKVRTPGRESTPFVVRAQTPGGMQEFLAGAVIDASGTWTNPNPLGAAGLPAVGEERLGARVSGALPQVLGPDRARFANRRVLVVGAGHSAATTLLDLADLKREEPGTEIVWVLRTPGAPRAFGGGELDALPARGKLGTDLRSMVVSGAIELITDFQIAELEVIDDRIEVISREGEWGQRLKADGIVRATGFRPDLQMLGELRLDLDPALECPAALGPMIDPNEHTCGTVRPHGARELAHHEQDFYVVGVKSYGRAPTFLLATGYEQVRSVVAALSGDQAAADQVRLELPETGVCTSTLNILGDESTDGCGSGCGDGGQRTELPVVAQTTPASSCCGPAQPADRQVLSA
jgi:hypothetical protein